MLFPDVMYHLVKEVTCKASHLGSEMKVMSLNWPSGGVGEAFLKPVSLRSLGGWCLLPVNHVNHIGT